MTAKELDKFEAALKGILQADLYWKYAEFENQSASCRYKIGEDSLEYDEYWKELVAEAEREMRKLEKTFTELRNYVAVVIEQAKRAA